MIFLPLADRLCGEGAAAYVGLVEHLMSLVQPSAQVQRRTRNGATKPALVPVPSRPSGSLAIRAAAVAEVAEGCADDVDQHARFPVEAIETMRAQQLLGAMVPAKFGGEGASVSDMAGICHRLGSACSSSAMIFAMHQVKVACLVRHGQGNAWREAMLRRLVEQQWLLASSTTEGGNGGNIRSSDAAVVAGPTGFTYGREASVISYGEYADALVTTARRDPDAASSDQVLLWLLADDYTMERKQEWETLGMRGTCSRGFRIEASARSDQILDVPYSKIHTQTMMPVAHLLWSSAWTGIAAAAVERTRLFIRNAMQQSGGKSPPGAAHFTEARRSLTAILSQVQSCLRMYEIAADDERTMSSLDMQTALNLLKVEVSEGAVKTIMSAMRGCGLSGYRTDSPFSQGRLLRDALSAPIMINNDRILAGTGHSALLGRTPTLFD